MRAASQPLVQTLLAWWEGARVGRDALPWRSTRDPWAVLLAETMLSQTPAARVASRYRELADAFPTPQACAAATPGEVVRQWSGLGYNRRALLLHGAATEIVARHAGAVPSELDALLALPGVGPYTARAVQAFAFDLPVGVVDTNIGRVLARAVAGRRLRASEAQALATSLVPHDASRSWNLAIMDFGSLVCSARQPSCDDCALHTVRLCSWRGARLVADDPASGSAGVTGRQPSFAGSDREGRGRLVRAACRAPVRSEDVAAVAGWPDDPSRAAGVASRLVAEGLLAVADDGALVLP